MTKNLCTFSFQFPGGSDNYLTISGSSHPFLSSSEVGLYIFTLRGNWILQRFLCLGPPVLLLKSVSDAFRGVGSVHAIYVLK